LVRFMANTDPSVVQRTAKERPLILAALEARDADRAAQLMEAHIEGVCTAVVAQIQRLEAEDEE
jgi:DNA-binding GntR family transcriptional regulator